MKNSVMDHYRNPRNTADLSALSIDRQYENPSCGDWVRLLPVVSNSIVESIQFEGEGCSLSIAAASMLTCFLKGKSVQDAVSTAKDFIEVITDAEKPFDTTKWQELSAFEEIRSFPIRQKCVTLPFHAIISELKSYTD